MSRSMGATGTPLDPERVVRPLRARAGSARRDERAELTPPRSGVTAPSSGGAGRVTAVGTAPRFPRAVAFDDPAWFYGTVWDGIYPGPEPYDHAADAEFARSFPEEFADPFTRTDWWIVRGAAAVLFVLVGLRILGWW